MTTGSKDAEELRHHLERVRKRIGNRRGPLTVKAERHLLLRFSQSIGETNPIYLDEGYAKETRFGGIIAPPTFVSYFLTQLSESMYDLEMPGFRHLHSDDVGEERHPILVDDVISGTAHYLDAWVHEGRSRPILFQTVETTLVNQRDQPVASARMIVVTFR